MVLSVGRWGLDRSHILLSTFGGLELLLKLGLDPVGTGGLGS